MLQLAGMHGGRDTMKTVADILKSKGDSRTYTIAPGATVLEAITMMAPVTETTADIRAAVAIVRGCGSFLCPLNGPSIRKYEPTASILVTTRSAAAAGKDKAECMWR